MFKHCLSKFSCALVMMCALVTGGLLQSCEDVFDFDDYKYDDGEPEWLGPSIYEFLKTGNAGHTYENYVQLIEDLDQKEVLSRTGSRTMFVADDAAFDRFFNSENAWGVKNYNDFTLRQKKVLLYNVMLRNAYLLDMLASIKSDPTSEQTGGDCLRRETMATLYDSVPFFTNEELTVDNKRNTLRLPQNSKPFDYYRDYLAAKGKNGIRVALGNNKNDNPMMVHFLYEYARTNNVLDSDFDVLFNKKVTGKSRTGTEGFIFSSKIVKSDVSYGDLSDDTMTITCKNGYLYRIDDVFLPPSNMAQVLREQENTKLFSRMLDRFAYLEYDKDFSEKYNALYHNGKPEENENVYFMKYALKTGDEKKGQIYYSPDQNGRAGKDYLSDGSVEDYFGSFDYLDYDPGNAQHNSGNGLQSDMGAIFVPTDEMIYRFFAPLDMQSEAAQEEAKKLGRLYGAGAPILQEYCADADIKGLKEEDGKNYYEKMQPCLDSVALDKLAAFIRNLMQKSFINTIPSNFGKVRDDAGEPLGVKTEDVDECIIANNGVIYILNNVFGPAEYQSVMAPSTVMDNMLIMRTIIDKLQYKSYLLSMKSKFSFICPDDSNFVYYDVSTYKSKTPKAYKFTWGRVSDIETEDGLVVTEYTLSPMNGDETNPDQLYSIVKEEEPKKLSFDSYKKVFADLMDYFVILGNVESENGKPVNKYYQTKGYGTVKVTKDGNGKIKLQGGEQLEISRALGREVYVGVQEGGRYPEANGVTYSTEGKDERYISGVVSPPTRSVYSYVVGEETDDEEGEEIIGEQHPFHDFGELCMALSKNDSLYNDAFFKGEGKKSDVTKMVDKYRVFSNDGYVFDQVVPFFSKYHYTVYVPQPSALEEAYKLGLPTYDDIKAENDKKNFGRAAAMIEQLSDFIRYHFQDNSVLVDSLPFTVVLANGDTVNNASYETSVVDEKTGRFFELYVKSDDGTLTVQDAMGNVAKVMNEPGKEGETWNILTRDIIFSNAVGKTTTKNVPIESSSYAVIHQIDKALYNSNLIGYDGNFRRFSKNGEPIETKQIPVPVSYDAASDVVTYNNEDYLLGKAKTFRQSTDKGTINMGTYYLMKPLENSDNKFEKEDYFFLGDTAKVLITDAGHLVDVDKSNKLRYLWADLKPLSVNAQGVAYPDSIVTVLPNGTFVDAKGKVIKK